LLPPSTTKANLFVPPHAAASRPRPPPPPSTTKFAAREPPQLSARATSLLLSATERPSVAGASHCAFLQFRGESTSGCSFLYHRLSHSTAPRFGLRRQDHASHTAAVCDGFAAFVPCTTIPTAPGCCTAVVRRRSPRGLPRCAPHSCNQPFNRPTLQTAGLCADICSQFDPGTQLRVPSLPHNHLHASRPEPVSDTSQNDNSCIQNMALTSSAQTNTSLLCPRSEACSSLSGVTS